MEYKYVVLINTTIGFFMALLDSNIVLISLPTIIRQLPDTTAFDGIWIIMGYVLVNATLLLAFGRLADIFGRVKLYNIGFAIFTVGSGLCSVSPNGLSLVGFRLVQGIGGALVSSNTAALITDAFPASERGKAIGINQVAGITGSVIGLIAGGVLTSTLGWRSIFWINLPIGVFATIWAFRNLKELSIISKKHERIDYPGSVLFALGLSVSLLGLTFGGIGGFSPLTFLVIAFGLLLLGFFVYVETKTESPMMDLTLFRIRDFSAGITSNLLVAVSRGAVMIVLVVYFQGALLLDAFTAGISMIPFSVAFVSAGPLSGVLSDRYGPRWFILSGVALSTAGFFFFSILPAGVPYGTLVLPMIIVGVGGGLFFAPNITSIMNSVPVVRRGIASAMSTMLLNTGFLLSLSISFAVFAAVLPLNTLQDIFAGLPVSGGLDINLFTDAMHEIFYLMSGISVIALAVSFLTITRKKKEDG